MRKRVLLRKVRDAAAAVLCALSLMMICCEPGDASFGAWALWEAANIGVFALCARCHGRHTPSRPGS